MKKQKERFAWGIKNIHFIWHGTNADPEVSYRKHVVNYYTIENTMWKRYVESCTERGIDPNYEWVYEFNKFCQERAKEIKEMIMKSK